MSAVLRSSSRIFASRAFCAPRVATRIAIPKTLRSSVAINAARSFSVSRISFEKVCFIFIFILLLLLLMTRLLININSPRSDLVRRHPTSKPKLLRDQLISMNSSEIPGRFSSLIPLILHQSVLPSSEHSRH